VDVRIIAATNRPLETLIAEGQFRSDLYIRLRVMSFEMPPLRDRGKDVLLLAGRFMELHGRRYEKPALRFSHDAEAAIVDHAWPGNVRELRNLIEQVVLLAEDDVIHTTFLPLSSLVKANRNAVSPGNSNAERPFTIPAEGIDLEEVERSLVLQALERSGWNVSHAAKLLRVSRDTLRYRIEKFGFVRAKQTE
jgi:DNA-binding NtrC family response regulator